MPSAVISTHRPPASGRGHRASEPGPCSQDQSPAVPAIGATVNATVDPGTFIVTITATSADQVAAAKYVNAVANN